MNNKMVAGAVIIVVLVVAVIAIATNNNNSDDEGPTITYIGNGGTTSSNETSYETTGIQLQDCKFTNPGYVFWKWSTQPDGTGDVYSENSNMYSNGNNGYDDLTVYAIWGYEIENVNLVGYDEVNYANGSLMFRINDDNRVHTIANKGNILATSNVIPSEKINLRIEIGSNMYGWKYDEETNSFWISNQYWDYRVYVDVNNAIIIDSKIYPGANGLELIIVPTGPLGITVVYT